MTSSTPWRSQLSPQNSVADETLYHNETGNTYVFSNNYSRLFVNTPPTQNGVSGPLELDLGESIKPICFAKNEEGHHGHNSGILCWKTTVDSDTKGVLWLEHIWVLSGGLRRKEHQPLFTSENLLKRNNVTDPASTVSLIREIKSIHYATDSSYVLNTGAEMYLLTVERGRNPNISPLFVSTLDLSAAFLDAQSKNELQFVTFRPTTRPGVHLLVMYRPLDNSIPAQYRLVTDVPAQLVFVEVGLVEESGVGRFERSDGMIAGILQAHTFTHTTSLQVDEVSGVYIVALADTRTVAISEIHTVAPHAHTLDIRPQSARSTNGISTARVDVDDAIPKTLCIITPKRTDWGFGPGESVYEVVVKSAQFAFRILSRGGEFHKAVEQLRG